VPHRIEIQLVDRRPQKRGRPVDLADHAGVARHHAVAFDRLDLRRGNVHHHVFLRQRAAEFLQPGEIGAQLAQAGGGGHVERRDRALVDDAGRRQAVRGLEALDRLLT
jgi:hypothetical protein